MKEEQKKNERKKNKSKPVLPAQDLHRLLIVVESWDKEQATDTLELCKI